MKSLLDRISQSYEAKYRNSFPKLYLGLYDCIKTGISQNELPEGHALPATRLLAEQLNLSRSTVIKAYELLSLEGYVVAKPGSGYQIRPGGVLNLVSEVLPGENSAYPPISRIGKSFIKNVGLINTTSDKSIAFRPGLPPLDIFPVNQWKNLSNLYWRYIKSSALSYSPSSGLEPLKKSIAAYLNITRNLKCDPRQVIIVSGSLQSLYLIGTVLINNRDTVVMENPTFPNVHSLFKSLRANIKPVGLDEEGLLVSRLTEKEHGKAKLIHTTPSIHYPTGVRMSLARRMELLAWADRHQALIIENDYEHEVSNWNNPLPALFSLDTQARTIYMGTFNRLLHPSVRLGYMVVPFYLLEAVETLQKLSHRFVSPSLQIVMQQFIEKKYLINHVKNLIGAAEARKEVFRQTFAHCFADKITLTASDSDSLYVLAKLPKEYDDKAFVSLLEQHHIIAHAYSKCFIDGKADQGLILGYASVGTPIIRKTLPRMAKLWSGTNIFK